MKRFFVEMPLAAGATLALPAPLQHRLRHVLCMAAGDELLLFNPQGTLARATLADAKARAATVEELLPEPAPLPPLTLAIALLKRDAWETVLRQATEMGATRIVPLRTAFAQVGKLNHERATAIMAEAAEQSERTTLPQLESPTPLEDFLHTLAEPCLWAYERLERHTTPTAKPPSAYACALVGPEGGFSPAEVALLQTHPQLHATSLGPAILRADTAAVAALALTRHCF